MDTYTQKRLFFCLNYSLTGLSYIDLYLLWKYIISKLERKQFS